MYKPLTSAKDDLIATGQKIFYKFSKSSIDIAEKGIFAEDAFVVYKENKTTFPENDYGLSFCMKREKILACAIYGDVLTQIILDPSSKSEYEYGEEEEWPKFAEVRTNRILVGKQFSISDASVLKECMLYADKESLDRFFGDKTVNDDKIEVVYEKLGFVETKKMVEQMRPYYEKFIHYNDKLDDFRQKLEELYPSQKDDFTFEKADKFYETTNNIGKPSFGRNNKIDYTPPTVSSPRCISTSYVIDMIEHLKPHINPDKFELLTGTMNTLSQYPTTPDTTPKNFGEMFEISEKVDEYIAEHPMQFINTEPKLSIEKQIDKEKRIGDNFFENEDYKSKNQGLLSSFINKTKQMLNKITEPDIDR